MWPACPGPRVTCQIASTPRSSRKRETNPRRPPARPLPATGFSTRCASRFSKIRGKLPEPLPQVSIAARLKFHARVKLRAVEPPLPPMDRVASLHSRFAPLVHSLPGQKYQISPSARGNVGRATSEKLMQRPSRTSTRCVHQAKVQVKSILGLRVRVAQGQERSTILSLHGEHDGKLPASVGLAGCRWIRVPVPGLWGVLGSRGRRSVGAGGREGSR